MMSGMGIGIIVVVIMLVTIVPTLYFVFKMLGGLHKAAKQEQELLATGTPAQGQIVAVQQTGTYVNNQPQVAITVAVYPPGGQPYQAQMLKILSILQIPQFQPGTPVQVRYDPQNPARIAIAGVAMPQMQGYGAPQMPQGGYPGGMPPGGMPPGGAPPPGGYGGYG